MSKEGTEFGIKLRTSGDGREETIVGYNMDTQQLFLDRSKSGLGDGGRYGCRLELMEGSLLKIHILLDRSSVEIFGNKGESVISGRIYPDPKSIGMELFAVGGCVKLHSLNIWELG